MRKSKTAMPRHHFTCNINRLIIAASAWLAWGPAAAQDLSGIFRDSTLGLELIAPEGWLMTSQTGFPSLRLLLESSKAEATIALSIGQIKTGGSLDAFVAENNRALQRLGVRLVKSLRVHKLGRAGWRVWAELPATRQHLRQFYLPHRGRVLIWTLRSTIDDLKQTEAELNQLLGGVKFFAG